MSGGRAALLGTFLLGLALRGAALTVRGFRQDAEVADLMTASGSWSDNVDIVIPWSGSPANRSAALPDIDVKRERYNGELPYMLRSIAKHAPWVRAIWILVDPSPTGAPVEVPKSLSSRTRVLNRCLHMPQGTCPARNTQSVQAFAHLLPGLAERFIIAQDDIFLGRPVTPADFYDPSGKPYVWSKAPTWGFFKGEECHRIYQDPSVFLLDAPRSSAPSNHYWYPQLKSASLAAQHRYPEFYAFVGSHVNGRYSSRAKGPSDVDNSQEECSFGWMNCEMLRTNSGVLKDLNEKRGEEWNEVNQVSERAILQAEGQHPIFMNIQDYYSEDPGTYKMQIGEFHAAMEKLFPREAEVVVTDVEP